MSHVISADEDRGECVEFKVFNISVAHKRATKSLDKIKDASNSLLLISDQTDNEALKIALKTIRHDIECVWDDMFAVREAIEITDEHPPV